MNPDFRDLTEEEQVNKARMSWEHLPRTEIERMEREYEETLDLWERRRLEMEARRIPQGAAGEGVVEQEAEDESMGGVAEEGAQGGFTAVNG